MNKTQALHVGMINSFNLITERATFEEIIMSGVGMFAHVPDEDVSSKDLDLIIEYFQELEMFEHCAELFDYRRENFKNDGTPIVEDCECDFPEIEEYSLRMKCASCNKRLKR